MVSFSPEHNWLFLKIHSEYKGLNLLPKMTPFAEAEKERAQSAERIQSLHTRLHQEADKIRKWKTSTEMELKEKVSHVNLKNT